MTRRPAEQTIISFLAWLQEHGLRVYGPTIDKETGEEFESLMDYTAEDVIKITKLLDEERTWTMQK